MVNKVKHWNKLKFSFFFFPNLKEKRKLCNCTILFTWPGGLKIRKGAILKFFLKKGRRFLTPIHEQDVRMLLCKINRTRIETVILARYECQEKDFFFSIFQKLIKPIKLFMFVLNVKIISKFKDVHKKKQKIIYCPEKRLFLNNETKNYVSGRFQLEGLLWKGGNFDKFLKRLKSA